MFQSPFNPYEPLEPEARQALDNTINLAAELKTLVIDCSLMLYSLIYRLKSNNTPSGSQTLDRLLQQPEARTWLQGAVRSKVAEQRTSGEVPVVAPNAQRPLDREAQSALRSARRAWPVLPISVPMVLVAVIEESESACAVLSALTTGDNLQQHLLAIKDELHESVARAASSNQPGLQGQQPQQHTWNLSIIKSSYGAKFANFHVSLRDVIIRAIHEGEGRFPIVVTARLGEPLGCYLHMPYPMIGQVLADYLAWPDIDTKAIAPLRPNQPVYLVTGRELLDASARSSAQEVLIQMAKYVQNQRGLLILKSLELLVTHQSDSVDVQHIKGHLREQFRSLARVAQSDLPDRPLPVVALFQRDPLDANEETVAQQSLQCGVNEHMVLVSVRQYPIARAIGSIRDYHLREWLEHNFTVDGIDTIELQQLQISDPVQALADSSRRVQLRSAFDTFLRNVFSDLIDLEHGAYVNDERMRMPYLLVEVFDNIMGIIVGAIQNRAEERLIRATAYQARTEVSNLLREIPQTVPESVRQHYRPLLDAIEGRLTAMADQDDSVQIVRRDKFGRIVITRDMLTACFLGSNQSRFKWPMTLPRLAFERPNPGEPNRMDDGGPMYRQRDS